MPSIREPIEVSAATKSPKAESRRFELKVPRINYSGWAFSLLLVGIWQLIVGMKWVDFNSIRSPLEIASATGRLILAGTLQNAIAHTLFVAMTAAGIAAILGTTIGVLMGLFPTLRAFLSGSIDFLRILPVVGLFSVVLLIWGTASESEIAVAAYAATWVMTINTLAGVLAIQPLQWDVARMLHLSRFNTIRKVVIPSAMPSILVGYRLGIVSALIVTITAEMLINPAGIGWELIRAQSALRPDEMWVYVVFAGTLGYIVNRILVWLVRLALPGSPAARAE